MSPQRLLPVLLLSLLTGCSGFKLSPHRIDVQQGNALDEEAVVRLKPGLTRSQVRFLLGSPLIVDPFRDNRWDYVYVFHKAGRLTEQKRITLFFDGDVLVRMEGDLPPAAAEAAAAPAAAASAPVMPPESVAETSRSAEPLPQPPEATAVAPNEEMPAAQPAAEAATPPEDAVLAAVRDWADDWSRRDAQAYFARYADDYRPQSGSRKDWEKRRRQLIDQAKRIEVRIESPKVDLSIDGRATVIFDQHYRSDTYQDAVRKQLRMVERDGQWFIVEERVLANLGGNKP